MTEQNGNSREFNAENEAWSKNWLVPILLLMLRQWSSYGYELIEKISAFGLAAMNPGSFYRTLRRMEKDGMVISNWDTSEGGPARRVYFITDAGRVYLNQWMQSLYQYQRMMDTFFHIYTAQPTPREKYPEGEKGAGAEREEEVSGALETRYNHLVDAHQEGYDQDRL